MTFSDPKAKALALNNSRHLNRHRWSTTPAVDQAVDELYDDLKGVDSFDKNKKLRKKHLKVIALDLYNTWLSDPERYVAYSRNVNDYKANPRYNKLRITSLVVDVVDALLAREYIEHHIGNFARTSFIHSSHLSRMRAKDKLIALLQDHHKVAADAIDQITGVETIILRKRDDEGRNRDIDYRDNPKRRQMRKKVEAYNALLAKTDIALPEAPPDGIPNKTDTAKIKIDLRNKFVRRIFNNGSWDEGGRFYGGWWQRIGSDWRVRISINGSTEGSTEIDYSGLHIVILYAMEGIDYWRSDGKDPYQLEDYEQSDRMRGVLKLMLLIAINAKNKDEVLGAISKEMNFHPDDYDWVDFEVADLIDTFASRHAPISKYLYSGFGVKLQRVDADIADRVINHFTDGGIPILCVHDSFVIENAHSNELVKIMESAVVDVMSGITGGVVTDIKPTMKVKTYWDVKMKEIENDTI